MREWYSAKELADAHLPGMPGTVQGIKKLANREKWEAQRRLGKGGGCEYHIANLRHEVRQALVSHQVTCLLPVMNTPAASAAKTPAPRRAFDRLTDKQRHTADARSTILAALEELKAKGVNLGDAITTLLTQATTGYLVDSNPVLDAALRMAKDSRGRTGTNGDYPSSRSLRRWLTLENTQLAPQMGGKQYSIPTWASAFLACWQRPEKPSVAFAYEQFAASWEGDVPSIHAVRRFINKLGKVSREQGRIGQRELKNLLPFVRRDFSSLKPGDVYSADGHCMDLEVQHPLHGRPFRPEVTAFIDIATRRVVGFSVGLAESSLAVLDALMDACTQAVPAVIYVDNGSGYCNALMKDESLGVVARLGSHMTHSIPYNSQARGVIERVHQTLWVEGAKAITGFVGKGMDQQERQRQFKLTRKAIKKGGALPLMSWADFMAWCEERVSWYNARPHSSLPKAANMAGHVVHLSPDECWQRHSNDGWQAMTLSLDEAALIFRPRVERTVLRGEIKLMNNIYFSQELTEWHSESVQVAYDIHHAEWVWVYAKDGRLICKAQWNANRENYFPQSVIEAAREKRADARARRLEAQLEEVEAERQGKPALEHNEPVWIPGVGNLTADLLRQRSAEVMEAEVIEVQANHQYDLTTLGSDERIALYLAYQDGKPVPQEHQRWFQSYPKSKEFQAWQRQAG